jgi:hypothetical protein
LNPRTSRAKQLRQQQFDIEVKQRSFRASPAFFEQLGAAFLEIEAAFREALPLLRAARPRHEVSIKHSNLEIVVSAGGCGLTLNWYRPANTLRRARLFVSLWNHPVDSFESAASRARKLREETFTFDLSDSGRAKFFAADQRSSHTSTELAAVCVNLLADRSRCGLLRWLSW